MSLQTSWVSYSGSCMTTITMVQVIRPSYRWLHALEEGKIKMEDIKRLNLTISLQIFSDNL